MEVRLQPSAIFDELKILILQIERTYYKIFNLIRVHIQIAPSQTGSMVAGWSS